MDKLGIDVGFSLKVLGKRHKTLIVATTPSVEWHQFTSINTGAFSGGFGDTAPDTSTGGGSACRLAVGVNGSDLQVNVTGEAATTINWVVCIQVAAVDF